MATREQLEAELTSLNAVLAAGIVSVSKGERRVQYDLTEARRRRDEIRLELGGLGGVPVRRVLVYSMRGLW